MGIIACRINGIAQQIANGGMVVLPSFIDIGQRIFLIQKCANLLFAQKGTFQTNRKFALDHELIGVVHNFLRAMTHKVLGIPGQFGIHFGLQQIIVGNGHPHPLSCCFWGVRGSVSPLSGADSSVWTYSLIIFSAL